MKRQFGSSIVGLVALVLLVSAASAAVSTQALAQNESIDAEQSTDDRSLDAANAWSAYRADDGRTGATVADGPGPYGEATSGDTFTGEPVGAPTVVDGTAYLAVETQLEYYKKSGAVAAYDADAGAVQWQRTGLGDPHGSPTVVDGTVYVATESADFDRDWAEDSDGDGGLYALDAETGETEWVRNDTEFWLDTPVHHGGALYTVRKTAADEGVNTSLVAIEPDTGETIWSVEADDLVGAADGTVYGLDDGDLFAADADTGERTWSVEASTVGDHGHVERVAVGDDALYAVHDGPDDSLRVAAFAAADGSTRWNVTLADDYDEVYRPAVADGAVFVTADPDQELVRLDAASGAETWRYEAPDGHLRGGPTVANDTVYVGSSTIAESDEPGEFYRPPNVAVFAVDAHDGTQQWGYVTDSGTETGARERVLAPSVVGDRLYLSSHDGGDFPSANTGYLHVFEPSETSPTEDHAPSDGHYEEDTAPDVAISTSESDPDDEFGNEKTVVLNGSASSVRYGTITSYEWDVDGDGTFESTGSSVSLALEECQSTTVTLRVTTDEGETATASVTVSNT